MKLIDCSSALHRDLDAIQRFLAAHPELRDFQAEHQIRPLTITFYGDPKRIAEIIGGENDWKCEPNYERTKYHFITHRDGILIRLWEAQPALTSGVDWSKIAA